MDVVICMLCIRLCVLPLLRVLVDLISSHLLMSVCSIPPDRLLGEVRIPLKEYDAGTVHDCWFKLIRYRDEHMVPTHATLHLRFSYQLSEDTEMYAALDSSYASLLEVRTCICVCVSPLLL